MKMTLLILCLPFFLVEIVSAAYTNKTLEGYYTGFLSDCPGSMKPTIITRNKLKYLEIHVSGAKFPNGKRTKYNYDTIGLMAKDPSMDWSKRTMFYIPGWLETIKVPMGRTMENVYKRRGYNVWILDAPMFLRGQYPVAARAIMAVGRHTGEMIANLTAAQPEFAAKKLDLLGLSLGGQTMSFIAKSYQDITGVKISRLTGLDPAGPCFRNRGPEGRIDESDADFVDVVYTNLGNAGMSAPVGHVNFYVNGGEYQPGDLYYMACNSICSHLRAYTLWLASLLHPDSFIAIKCNTVQDARDNNCYGQPQVTNLLGIDVDRNEHGIFYLATKNRFPYFLGKNGLEKKHNYIMRKLTDPNKEDVLVM